jgi:phage protein D
MHPGYELKIGSKEFKSGSSESLLSLELSRCLGLPIDSLEGMLVGGTAYPFEKGDEVTLKLGYGSDLVPVFTGLLNECEVGISKVRVFALGGAVKLLNLRVNAVYQNQTSGDIVKSLAQEVKLDVKEGEDGIDYSYYVVDGRQNAYEHMLRLAEKCDFDVYMTPAGELVFKKFEGKDEHKFAYGKDIIQIELSKTPQYYDGVVVFGESPSSTMGAETYHWLAKEELKAKTEGSNPLGVRDPSIKSNENAEKVAQAIKSRLEYSVFMTVEVVGRAEVKPGDSLVLEGFADATVDGKYEVTGIEHSLSKSKGFTSRFQCRRK